MRYTYEYKGNVELYREGKWPEPEGVSDKSFRDKVRLWVNRGIAAVRSTETQKFQQELDTEERLELVSQ